MLDQLVESKSNAKENKIRGGYLLTTFVLVTGLMFSAVLWSLYAKDLGIGREEFELSTLVTPLSVNENTPALPKEQKREQSVKTVNEVVTRQSNMLRVDEQQDTPNKISAAPNQQKARPNGNFLVRDGLEVDLNSLPYKGSGDKTGISTVGISNNNQTARIEITEKVIPPPPSPVKKVVEAPIEKKKTVISGGVVNGQATSLPKPLYPPTAKAVNAGGAVNVQVTIDESGNVVSAKAVDGHPLLREAAEKAARNAKFKPTLLTGVAVKVTGVIVYNFAVR